MSRLKEIRTARMAEAKRYSQASLAQVAGVCVPTFRKLEEHPEEFTVKQQQAIAEYFGMSASDIFLPEEVN